MISTSVARPPTSDNAIFWTRQPLHCFGRGRWEVRVMFGNIKLKSVSARAGTLDF